MWVSIVAIVVVLIVIKIVKSKVVHNPEVNTHNINVETNYFAYSKIKEATGIKLNPLEFGQSVAHEAALASSRMLDKVSAIKGPLSYSLNGYEKKLQAPLMSLRVSVFITYIREVLNVSPAVIDDFRNGAASYFHSQNETVSNLFLQCLRRYEEAHRREFNSPQEPLESNQVRFGSPIVNLFVNDIKRLFEVDGEWDEDPNFLIFSQNIEFEYDLFLVLGDIKGMGLFYVK